jgi:hypothetical protein
LIGRSPTTRNLIATRSQIRPVISYRSRNCASREFRSAKPTSSSILLMRLIAGLYLWVKKHFFVIKMLGFEAVVTPAKEERKSNSVSPLRNKKLIEKVYIELPKKHLKVLREKIELPKFNLMEK